MRRVAKEMSKKLKEVGVSSSSKGNSPGKKSGASRSTNVRVKNQGHVMLRPGTMHSLIEELCIEYGCVSSLFQDASIKTSHQLPRK